MWKRRKGDPYFGIISCWDVNEIIMGHLESALFSANTEELRAELSFKISSEVMSYFERVNRVWGATVDISKLQFRVVATDSNSLELEGENCYAEALLGQVNEFDYSKSPPQIKESVAKAHGWI